MKQPCLLNIKEIESSLRIVQKNFDQINTRLDVIRDPLQDIIIENMLLGYDYLNSLLAHEVKLLHRTGLHHILELNFIVLCGTDTRIRKEYINHIKGTTDRFYEQEECNIGQLVTWYTENKKKSVWKRAAGVYILMLSQPQLFFEGNHRTGALLMSYILAYEGNPPFVLNFDNAEGYFNPSSLIKLTRKNVVSNLWKLPKIQKYFARFLNEQKLEQYLCIR